MRDQQFLLPPDMRDWLGSDHPVWAVIDLVAKLDTSAFHRWRRTGGVGRAGYDPDMLLTLLIWAWSRGLRSSRGIERACADVVPYRVICAGEGPDHVTISRFRAQNHRACEDLFTQVLVLAARLGLGRLETVALDGVKIASNASLAANRSGDGLCDAAAAEAARIAARIAAEHAATDAAEDEAFGDTNPGLMPPELADPATRAARIAEAIADMKDRGTAAGPSETAAPGPVRADRTGRIIQAQGQIDALIAADTVASQAVADRHTAKVAAAEKHLADVAGAAQAKQDSWADRGPVGSRRAGRRPVPVEDNVRVRDAQARLDRVRAKADKAQPAPPDPGGYRVNLTDPQSRIQPLRGGGWLQGYNCQAVTSADGLIVATGVGTSPVDNQYWEHMVDRSVAAAGVIDAHRPVPAPTPGIGVLLADAGYCTEHNLTSTGPDRLIATGKSHALHIAANTDPARGPAPEDADPIDKMAHRLRTTEGITAYRKRSHIAETPFGHAKHNLGFRRFTSRGLARARSEWAFHASVHNISKIMAHLAAPPLPA